MTQKIIIKHPTNGLYSTEYAVLLSSTKNGVRNILLGFTRRKTHRAMIHFVKDEHKQIMELTGGTGFTVRKGVLILLDADGNDSGWFVTNSHTKRELHGRTLEIFEVPA